MNNLATVAASRSACYCHRFTTVLNRVRSAARLQKTQGEKLLVDLNGAKLERVFPLPGLIGLTDSTGRPIKRTPLVQTFIVKFEDEKLNTLFSEVNQPESRLKALNLQLAADMAVTNEESRAPRPLGMRIESDQVECVVQECPRKMRLSFRELFPSGIPVQPEESLSAVIISHHTQNDMSVWSSEMELERDELTAQFVEVAKEIVGALRENGVWADFIDPSSGRPFYSPYTNATMFETDERLKQFGFQIQDLGCCKCLEHPIWGPKAFVGFILTGTASNHPVLKGIIQSKIE